MSKQKRDIQMEILDYFRRIKSQTSSDIEIGTVSGCEKDLESRGWTTVRIQRGFDAVIMQGLIAKVDHKHFLGVLPDHSPAIEGYTYYSLTQAGEERLESAAPD